MTRGHFLSEPSRRIIYQLGVIQQRDMLHIRTFLLDVTHENVGILTLMSLVSRMRANQGFAEAYCMGSYKKRVEEVAT